MFLVHVDEAQLEGHELTQELWTSRSALDQGLEAFRIAAVKFLVAGAQCAAQCIHADPRAISGGLYVFHRGLTVQACCEVEHERDNGGVASFAREHHHCGDVQQLGLERRRDKQLLHDRQSGDCIPDPSGQVERSVSSASCLRGTQRPLALVWRLPHHVRRRRKKPDHRDSFNPHDRGPAARVQMPRRRMASAYVVEIRIVLGSVECGDNSCHQRRLQNLRGCRALWVHSQLGSDVRVDAGVDHRLDQSNSAFGDKKREELGFHPVARLEQERPDGGRGLAVRQGPEELLQEHGAQEADLEETCSGFCRICSALEDAFSRFLRSTLSQRPSAARNASSAGSHDLAADLSEARSLQPAFSKSAAPLTSHSGSFS
eukprot:306739-Rhodomonas_salina.1